MTGLILLERARGASLAPNLREELVVMAKSPLAVAE